MRIYLEATATRITVASSRTSVETLSLANPWSMRSHTPTASKPPTHQATLYQMKASTVGALLVGALAENRFSNPPGHPQGVPLRMSFLLPSHINWREAHF